MKLNVLERLVALSILPKEGDYATLKVLNQLRLSLSFTDEEFKRWGITNEAGKMTWQENGEEEIPIGEKATDIVIDALKSKNRAKALTQEAMSLYEKFIPS